MEIMDKIDTYRLCNSLMIKPTTQSRVMGDSYDKSVLHQVGLFGNCSERMHGRRFDICSRRNPGEIRYAGLKINTDIK